jgi:hypothetical protein
MTFVTFVFADYQILNVTGKTLLFKTGEDPEERDIIRIHCQYEIGKWCRKERGLHSEIYLGEYLFIWYALVP